MPSRLVYYPNRTKIRHFTEKDVARIAQYAVRDGANPVKVLAAIAAALGLGASICTVAKSIRAALSITYFLKKMAIATALGQIVKTIIQVLLGVKLKGPPILNVIFAITIAALVLIDSLLEAIPILIANREDMLSTTDFLNNLCAHVKELSGEAIDIIEDTSAFDAAANTVLDAAFKLKSDTDQAWSVLIDTSLWDEFLAIFK